LKYFVPKFKTLHTAIPSIETWDGNGYAARRGAFSSMFTFNNVDYIFPFPAYSGFGAGNGVAIKKLNFK
jgi:hypothetical protein